MHAHQARELARQLAHDWARVERPNGQLTYTDYVTTLVGLATVTDHAPQTAAIFWAILEQAQRLGRSSGWVQTELLVETNAQVVGDRESWLLAELQNAGGTDAALDRYNERKQRFASKS